MVVPFFVKLAFTVRFSVTVKEYVRLVLTCAPVTDQWLNEYPLFGVAVNVQVEPAANVPPPETVPPVPAWAVMVYWVVFPVPF